MDDNGQSVSLRDCDPGTLLLTLKRVQAEQEHAEILRHGLVEELRRRRMPWAVIAETSGMNERTLRRRYSDALDLEARLLADHAG